MTTLGTVMKSFLAKTVVPAVELVEDLVDIVEVLPDKFVDAGVLEEGFVATIFGFVTQGQTLDAAIIDKGSSYMRDFGLENKGDVFMENNHSIIQP